VGRLRCVPRVAHAGYDDELGHASALIERRFQGVEISVALYLDRVLFERRGQPQDVHAKEGPRTASRLRRRRQLAPVDDVKVTVRLI
jgi:hypothetical protein